MCDGGGVSASVQVRLTSGVVAVDARDVAAWRGESAQHGGTDASTAESYVIANPRPPGPGFAQAQRMLLLRRLAAGPATTDDLLGAMRDAGWVGASDLDNRMRELRGAGGRGSSAAGLSLRHTDDVWALTEAFPRLGEADLRALAFGRAMIARLDTSLAASAVRVISHLAPELERDHVLAAHIRGRASVADHERFEAARVTRSPVTVRYWSANSRTERRYRLVPVLYATLGTTVKAICVEIDGYDGRGPERQLAMDRLLAVGEPESQVIPRPDLQLTQHAIELGVSARLYEVMIARNLLGVEAESSEQIDVDEWRVRGSFPEALKWDVLEQLCAWAGSVRITEPLWLVSAVAQRLRAGLDALEAGEPFAFVPPDDGRVYGDLGAAVSASPAAPADGPRKLGPRS